ncbi:YjgN family protein [Sphingomonas swuensis]|uniref:YjgN family protein n=1 Tax=Sphingomonas swuensis TaxID=977800 RepID=A0ABP7SBR2_9SPHN
MNYQGPHGAAGDDRAVRFTGNWREYLPIAATNVLLIIVTLGIYRFWASARERRYLWSRTHVIDDSLEWTGTGKEMFFGFLMVVAALLPFYIAIQFLFPALLTRGHEGAVLLIGFLLYVAFFWLTGFARFRALRYRLSRSWWHGIRGGSDDSGVDYANQQLCYTAACAFAAFIPFPWAQSKLWNLRWSKMSFGPHGFHADLDSEGLWRRWLFIYAVPVIMLVVGGILGGLGYAIFSDGSSGAVGFAAIFVGFFALIYLAIPLATLHWYAKFYRQAAASLRVGDLEFGFDARTRDWLKLFLGNIGLAVITLGLGIAYWGYRNWSFLVRHVHLYGSVDLDSLTQSQTHAPRESEGFADAFDMGAI